jgi:hypothetical protein
MPGSSGDTMAVVRSAGGTAADDAACGGRCAPAAECGEPPARDARHAARQEVERAEQQQPEHEELVVGEPVEDVRKHDDEDRADQVSGNRSDAAEDQRDQKQDRELEREGRRADVLVDVHEQRAGEPGEGGAQHECAHLVANAVHPRALGGNRVRLEREEGPSPVAAHHPMRRDEREHHRRVCEVEEVVSLEVEPAGQAQGRNVLDPLRALGEPGHLVREGLDDEPERDRRDRQIRSLQPQRGNSEGDTEQRGEDRRGGKRDPEAEPQLRHEDRGGVRAHGEEPRVSHAHVAVVADDEVEPRDDDGEDARPHQHRVHEVLVGREERDREREEHQQPPGAAQDVGVLAHLTPS